MTVTANGFVYDEGPQDGPCVPFDSESVHNLAFEIIDTDGSTVLETITSIQHEADSGEYYVTASGTHLDAAGLYIDRWYYTWVDGEGEQKVR